VVLQQVPRVARLLLVVLVFVVGYGLDAAQRHRNLPDIRVLE